MRGRARRATYHRFDSLSGGRFWIATLGKRCLRANHTGVVVQSIGLLLGVS